MNNLDKFIVLDTEMLATVEGGGIVGCVLGTAGSAGLGFLGGTTSGTFTVPIIGTVSGATVGAWSGAAVGIATFCGV